MIYNASGVTFQLGNFCFERVTLYIHFSAFKCSKYSYRCQWKWDGTGIELSEKCENGNEVHDWEWELDGNGNNSTEIGTTIVIPSHL